MKSLSLRPIEFVFFCQLEGKKNRVDWVCGVREGYRRSTIKVSLSQAVEWRMAFYWLHKRQIVFFPRTRLQTTPLRERDTHTEGERICIYSRFIITFFFFTSSPSLHLSRTWRKWDWRVTDVREWQSGDIHVNSGCSRRKAASSAPHKQLSSRMFASSTLKPCEDDK